MSVLSRAVYRGMVVAWGGNDMKRKLTTAIAVAFLFIGFIHQPAAAHGHIQVGDYDLVIGFHNEPAIQGEPNALDLFVTNTKTGERVNGLEDSLQAEIIFGASRKTLSLEPQEDEDGAYTAYLLPTSTGDYTWHIFGNIADTPVDVSMTSGPDTFGSVEAQADYAFPETGQAVDPSAQAAAAAHSARLALWVGIVGTILGLAGLVVGLTGLAASRQRGSTPG
jgi:hypothetical protein